MAFAQSFPIVTVKHYITLTRVCQRIFHENSRIFESILIYLTGNLIFNLQGLLNLPFTFNRNRCSSRPLIINITKFEGSVFVKTQKMKEIRSVGLFFLMISVMIAIYSFRNDIINGEELAAGFIMIVGLYLTFGSKESFKEWVDDPSIFDDEGINI